MVASCPTLPPMSERVTNERTLAVSVPGGEVIGVRSGSGRALLVLHGWPAVNDYSAWFAAELTGWDALRYTQRGVAPSGTEGPFTIKQHVSDALAGLDQHGVAAATALGHSWGGYQAMQLAVRAPGRVNALVLADTLGAVGDGGLAGFGAELAARATPEALARISELDELGTTSKEQEAAVALEYFRLEWPGYFAVPADAPPVPETVRVNPEGFEQTSTSVAEAVERGDLPGLLSGFNGPVELSQGSAAPSAAGGRVHGRGVPGRAADDRARRRASGLARGTGLPGCGEPSRRTAGPTCWAPTDERAHDAPVKLWQLFSLPQARATAGTGRRPDVAADLTLRRPGNAG